VKRWLLAALVLLLGRRRRRLALPPGRLPHRAARWAENLTLIFLFVAALAAAAFIVLYAVEPDTQFLGLALGLAFLAFAVACGVAGKRVVPQREETEPRPELVHIQEQDEVLLELEEGGEGVSRKRFLLLAGGGAAGVLGAALLTPALSCGPEANRILSRSPWRRGVRLVSEREEPLAAAGIVVGELVTAFPEGANKEDLASPVIVVRVRPEELELPNERSGWAPDGLVAYSKICTHAGCAVSEYRYPLYDPTSPGPAVVCPCHYSTFSVTKGGDRIFGPAGRALPQLPLEIDADGNLLAAGDFSSRPGPSWWGVRQG
jgi:ubiquinol-cytochrome c reductase iron-sulfur subunit